MLMPGPTCQSHNEELVLYCVVLNVPAAATELMYQERSALPGASAAGLCGVAQQHLDSAAGLCRVAQQYLMGERRVLLLDAAAHVNRAVS